MSRVIRIHQKGSSFHGFNSQTVPSVAGGLIAALQALRIISDALRLLKRSLAISRLVP